MFNMLIQFLPAEVKAFFSYVFLFLKLPTQRVDEVMAQPCYPGRETQHAAMAGVWLTRHYKEVLIVLSEHYKIDFTPLGESFSSLLKKKEEKNGTTNS